MEEIKKILDSQNSGAADSVVSPANEGANTEDLITENQRLLNELELAYKNMERIIEDSNREKQITYNELQQKLEDMEKLYQELSNKENMLIHMEKLSSIGQFITELIHELSSPLTAITLQAQIAVIKDIPDEIRKQFNSISEHAVRMSNLLGRFKAMAYKGKEDFKKFELNKNLSECLETLEVIKPKHLNISVELSADELQIWGDEYQTNQVYLNLAKNAFDAMKTQGKELTVKVRKISSAAASGGSEVSRIYCQQTAEWESILKNVNSFGLIEFIDQGSGISQEILREIFQPFFTTKERGKGTGLGLSISSDIAMRHGGNLAVKSVPGQGTTFQLLLPLIKE